MDGWWLLAGGFISTTGIILVLAAWRAAVHTDDWEKMQADESAGESQQASGSRG